MIMKKMNLMMAMAMAMTAMIGASDAKAEKVTILSNGNPITVELDYCWVNGKIEPCMFELQQEAHQDNDACWNPVTRRYESCI
jgi:hypothetical protein